MPCQIFATDQTRLTIPWLRPSLRDFGEARTPISPPPRLRRGDDDDAYHLRRSRGGPGLLQGPRRTSVSIRFQPRRRAGPRRARKPRPNLGASLKTEPGPLPGSRAGVLSAYPFLCRHSGKLVTRRAGNTTDRVVRVEEIALARACENKKQRGPAPPTQKHRDLMVAPESPQPARRRSPRRERRTATTAEGLAQHKEKHRRRTIPGGPRSGR